MNLKMITLFKIQMSIAKRAFVYKPIYKALFKEFSTIKSKLNGS